MSLRSNSLGFQGLQMILLVLATAVVTLCMGAAAGVWLMRSDVESLVMPKLAEQARAHQLSERLKLFDFSKDKLALEQTPMWQLTPDGQDLYGPQSKTSQMVLDPPQAWVLVGRAKRVDAEGVVLYQAQTKVSKFIKISERLPDGRTLVSIDEDGFELASGKSKKIERLQWLQGLTVLEPSKQQSPPITAKP